MHHKQLVIRLTSLLEKLPREEVLRPQDT